MNKGCPKCGRMIDSNAQICPYCNYDFSEMNDFFKKVGNKKFIEDEKYAGFFKRLIAGLLDILLIACFTLGILITINNFKPGYLKENIWLVITIYIVSYILLNAIMERTVWRGSIGKHIVGIKVVDQDENPLTFGQAILRNITKFLNVATAGIGFLLSAFPPAKQTISDRLMHTFVINDVVLTEDDNVEYASISSRFVAFILDVMILFLIIYGILWLGQSLSELEVAADNSVHIQKYTTYLAIFIGLIYFPLAEKNSGSSFGKKLLKIKVSNLAGEKIGFFRSFIRELLLAIDIVTLGFLLAPITRKKQTLKDIITKTIVIKR